LIPVPIVNGVIAGAVLPFVVGVFSFISTADGHVGIEVPIMVGTAVVAYLVGQRLLGTRLPAILPAFLAGLLVAGLTGQIGGVPASRSRCSTSSLPRSAGARSPR
jgi:predicted benzoate:H+ symporter BenE